MATNYANVNPEFLWSLDIETAANDKAQTFIGMYEEVSAPANYKDPEKIAAAIKEKQDSLMEKAALRWMTGKVVSYAFVSVGDVAFNRKPRVLSKCGFDESALLMSMMQDIEANNMALVGTKNGDGFDVPFIKGRCLANNIPMHELFASSYSFLDIDRMLSYSSHSNQVGRLDQYAFVLGLEGKTGNGANVPKQYLDAIAHRMDGNNEKVKEIMLGIKSYNERDALLTAQILARFVQRGDFNATK